MSFKVKDHYYKKAKSEKYLARSIYKLEELDKKFKLINPGDNVLDLGYYPGSWIQYAAKKVGKSGYVIGIDIQEVNQKIQSLENVKVFQKDIFSVNNLQDLEVDQEFDSVVSDMAPKTSGLKAGGNFTIKVFESQDAQVFLKKQRKLFKEVHFFRPKSTRSVSKEYFFVGKGYLGDKQ